MGSFTVEAVIERKSFYFYSGNENHFIFILTQAIIWKIIISGRIRSFLSTQGKFFKAIFDFYYHG